MNRGIALLTVLILSMVMAILAVGLASLNSSQFISDESQVDRIQAEQLLKGAHWYSFMSQITNGESSTPPPEELDGITFQIEREDRGDTGPNNTTDSLFTVNYR